MHVFILWCFVCVHAYTCVLWYHVCAYEIFFAFIFKCAFNWSLTLHDILVIRIAVVKGLKVSAFCGDSFGLLVNMDLVVGLLDSLLLDNCCIHVIISILKAISKLIRCLCWGLIIHIWKLTNKFFTSPLHLLQEIAYWFYIIILTPAALLSVKNRWWMISFIIWSYTLNLSHEQLSGIVGIEFCCNSCWCSTVMCCYWNDFNFKWKIIYFASEVVLWNGLRSWLQTTVGLELYCSHFH